MYAYLPFKYIGISQACYGTVSHKGLKAIDFGWKTGYDYKNLYAPFDCKVVYTEKSGVCVVESLEPVKYADGTEDYMCIITYHHNTLPKLNATFKQGEVYVQMGNNGAALHTHLEVQKGHFVKYTGTKVTGYNSTTKKNYISYDWANTVLPYEVLYRWDDAKYSPNASARPYEWKTVAEETDYKTLYENEVIKNQALQLKIDNAMEALK